MKTGKINFKKNYAILDSRLVSVWTLKAYTKRPLDFLFWILILWKEPWNFLRQQSHIIPNRVSETWYIFSEEHHVELLLYRETLNPTKSEVSLKRTIRFRTQTINSIKFSFRTKKNLGYNNRNLFHKGISLFDRNMTN